MTTSPRMKVSHGFLPLWLVSRTRTDTALFFLFIGEKARITAAGGFVDFGRVNGNLALSRAIGDFEFKKSAELAPEQQIVTAYPDVVVHDLSDDDEFLVLACDGMTADTLSQDGLTDMIADSEFRYLGLPVLASRR